MLRAIYRGQVLAETPRTVRVADNHYFPPDSVRREYLVDSPTRTLCPWRGIAHYYTIRLAESGLAEETVRSDAAWYYPHPTPLARRIKNHVAFDHMVLIEGAPEDPPTGLLTKLSTLIKVVGAVSSGKRQRKFGCRILPTTRLGAARTGFGMNCWLRYEPSSACLT